MKRFKILWKDYRYGESTVFAKDEKDAIYKAEMGHADEDFEELDPCGDWFIKEVTDITNE